MFKHDSRPRSINVKGMFMAVYLDNGQPVLFAMEGVNFLPIFSTIEKAEASLKFACKYPHKIQVITDHDDFMDSVAGKIRLMLDPWITDRGTTRFTELWPDPKQAEIDPDFAQSLKERARLDPDAPDAVAGPIPKREP